MRKQLLCLFIVWGLFLSLFGCSPATHKSVTGSDLKYDAECYDLFDTYCHFTFYNDRSDAENKELFDSLHQKLLTFHRLTDIYHSYDGITNLKDVNDAAGNGQALSISKDLFDFLSFCKDAYDESLKTVNVMLGSVTKLWEATRKTSVLPDEVSLSEAAKHTGIDLLVLDENALTVQITDPKASLDVGALAKGYAGDLAKAFLLDRNQCSFLLNLGGNILTNGTPLSTERDYFVIGIQDPAKPFGEYLDTISLSDGECAVTSGDYQRYVLIDGIRYHHILDPTTLYPSNKYHSVTVVCASSKDADLLSTALFILDEKEGRALAKEKNAVFYYH